MIIFNKSIPIYSIIKRHAGTSTNEVITTEKPTIMDHQVKTPQSTTPIIPSTSKHTIGDDSDEIQVDHDAPHFILKSKIKGELTESERNFLTDKAPLNNAKDEMQTVWQEFENNVGNQFTEEQVNTTNPFYVPPVLSKETIMLDQGVKLVTAQIDEISTRLGKEITKSTELASIWKVHLHAYDEYIKSLSTIPWKKVLIASATLITISAIAWKMMSMRAIPNFLGNMINLVPLPGGSLKIPKDVVSVPKPDIETTMRAVMETPLTPITIAASVGVLTVTLGLLKITLWVLRRAPK